MKKCSAQKPDGIEAILLHVRTACRSEVHAHEIAIIGDRCGTDVVFGNLAGFFTVLVEPLARHLDRPAIVRLLRPPEEALGRWLWRRFRQ